MIKWKTGGSRPNASLWLKIAQLATLIFHNRLQIDHFLRFSSTDQLIKYFEVPLSSFWQTHRSFEQPRSQAQVSISTTQAQILILNAVFPVLWLWAERQGKNEVQEQIINWATGLPSEKNRISRRWKSMGIACQNSLDSQALVHLERHYCQHQACTSCRIGKWIMSGTNAEQTAPAEGQGLKQKR